MPVKSVTPILNVASVTDSMAWFERLGWRRGFSWPEGDADRHASPARQQMRTASATDTAMADSSLSMDQIVQGLAGVLVLAHLGVLVWFFWFRRDITPIVVLNLLASGAVVAYWLPRLGTLFHYVDSVWAFVALEFAIFATSLAAIFKLRVPHAVIWAQFAINAIIIVAALYFMLTFTITRLF